MHKKKIKYNIIIAFIFLILMFCSGIIICKWVNENKKNEEIQKKISEYICINNDTKKIDIDFTRLKQINSDTIGWIKVNGTNIEYPVLKTDNNEYYLTHSFDKKYNSAGWIFADFRNIIDDTDKNLIIYGHNRKDGSMFGTLKTVLNDQWLKNNDNLDISFITENGYTKYKVFSVYKIEKEDYYIKTYFETDEEYLEFLKTIKKRSIRDFNVELTADNKIITLSTCSDNSAYRVVLHAKKIE